MAEIVLGVAGAVIGATMGNPAVGFQIGYTLGAVLFPREGPRLDRGRIDEVRIQGAQQGTAIPIIYGRNRTAGTIIWAGGLRERTVRRGRVTEHLYSTSLAVLVCEGPVSRIRRIWANTEVIYDWRTGAAPTVVDWLDAARVRVYLGGQTLPDTAIEAVEGAGRVPAFRGLCYVVFEDLQLAELGNQVPNLSFEVETTHANLRVVMEDIARRAGLTPAQYDFANLATYPVNGIVVGARTEAARIMEMVALANRLDIVESGGRVRAVPRTGTPVLSIPAAHIGASADGEPVPFVETARAQEVELPREFEVKYNSEAQDFQQFSQVARRTTRWSENQDAVAFPMSLPDRYARYLADSLLLEQWVSRTTYRLTLPYQYLRLDPGDVIQVPNEVGGLDTMRVVEISAGLLAQIEVRGVADDAAVYADPGHAAAVPPGIPPGAVLHPAATLIAHEHNAPTDWHANTAIIFMAAGSGRAGWHGGTVEVEPRLQRHERHMERTIGSISGRDLLGRTVAGGAGVLPPGPVGVLDTASAVTVDMLSGLPVSIAEDTMIRDLDNLAVIGREIVQYQTATLVSGTTYLLSRFLRGRRGTEYAVDSHVSGEPVVMLGEDPEAFPYHMRHHGTTASFRLLERGRDYSAGLPAFGAPIVLECRSRMPYAPVHLRAAGDRSAGTAPVTLSWVRRVRIDGGLRAWADAPLDETAERYDLEVWNAGMTVLLRTVSGLTGPTWTYSVADQTANAVQGAPFAFRVFQTTTWGGIGRGHPSGFALVPLFPLGA